MKHALSHTLAIVGLGLVTFAVTPVHAQTTANGPYYATPSWDQTLPASTRFIVLSNMANAAVLDRETGLVWERVPDTTRRVWASATRHCAQRTVAARQGWRLPSIQELRSLVDPTVTNPALPTGHPFTVLFEFPSLDNFYWSATTDASNANNAHIVTFNDANLFQAVFIKQLNEILAWCVRSGSGIEAQ